MKKVIIASDHAGYPLKKELAAYLRQQGYQVDDLGTNNATDSVDYPSFAQRAAARFLNQPNYSFGVLVCGTGIGISISANKIKGIRCALPQNGFAAQMAREHNNANFIAFGSRIDYQQPVIEILSHYLHAHFDPDSRHAKRVAMIEQID